MPVKLINGKLKYVESPSDPPLRSSEGDVYRKFNGEKEAKAYSGGTDRALRQRQSEILRQNPPANNTSGNWNVPQLQAAPLNESKFIDKKKKRFGIGKGKLI